MPQYDEGFTSKFLLEGCWVNPLRCKDPLQCPNWDRRPDFGCTDRDPLVCEYFVRLATTHIMRSIGMTPLREASVELHHPTDPDKSGSSAVTIICESHGGGHSWGEARAFRFVVDSCKHYDVARVADELCHLFNPLRCSVWVEERALCGLRDLRGLERKRGLHCRVGVISRLVTYARRRGRCGT